jgi:hypothetical protein
MRLSMNEGQGKSALFYPFHLCHVTTLEQLLARFETIHFRDYMALQLTPFFGTTAYSDRMGDTFPDLVRNGRLVQGHQVSGPLNPEAQAAINQDFGDAEWRALFHHGLQEDRRFQRGLWNFSHAVKIGPALIPGPAALLVLLEDRYRSEPVLVEQIDPGGGSLRSVEQGYRFEYGLALLKTAAALYYTTRLAHQLQLAAVTDSPVHYDLLERSRRRAGRILENVLIPRQDY